MTARKIALTKLRDLTIGVAPAPGRAPHLSAASGLVRVGGFLYVVADDELHLGVFGARGRTPGRMLRLFKGALPDSMKARKKRKPDLEALVLLPKSDAHKHGALLALGSGSRRNRRMGALLDLDAAGAVRGKPQAVDLTALLAPLDDEFEGLNIEGAVAQGGTLSLFQRANAKDADNAIVRFKLADVLKVLRSGRTRALDIASIVRLDLGRIDGIALGFTDAATLPGGDMIFTAVAEDTDNAYADGCCVGAAVGLADKHGRLRWLRKLDRKAKVEGIAARVDGDVIRLLLVTDADDAAVPAQLFSATIGAMSG
jgi:hypothetical protein